MKQTTIKCLYCGKEFSVPNWRAKKQKYCSRICLARATHGDDKVGKLYRNKEWMYQQYVIEGKSTHRIARELGVYQPIIWKWKKIHGIETIKRNYVSGKNNPNYKNGWWIEEGYKVISENGKNIREHRLVMEKILGRKLHPNERVHHLDGDKSNNNPENLMLFSTGSEHIKFEQKINLFAKKLIWGNLADEELKNKVKYLFDNFKE